MATRRTELLVARARQISASTLTIGAPVGGWNTRDSLDAMEPLDAIELDNWYPEFGQCRLRRGHTEHADSIGSGNVETLASFEGATTKKLLAASSTNIYDITSTGSGVSLGAGFTSGRWQHANMDDRLAFVNGADAPQVYDGTALSALAISGTGLTVSNLIGVNVFKSRSYWWEVSSQDFWYSDVNVLGGALTKFPLSRVGSFGGSLTTMITWTRDGGAGADDFAAFFMSSGDTIVYAGSDPVTWALVGVYRLGVPIGIRGVAKVGGDAIISANSGYQLLSNALPGGEGAPGVNVSDKINPAVRTQALGTGAAFGWETILYPRGNRILFNYPTTSTGKYEQHVVNLLTGAWCRFKGMNARSWAVHDGGLYFGGGAGKAFLADTGPSDNGANIVGVGRTAFTYLRRRGQRKKLSAIRPVLRGTGQLPVVASVVADFEDDIRRPPPVNFGFGGEGSPWNSGSKWNVTPWGKGQQSVGQWISRSAIGYAFSTRLEVGVANQQAAWTTLTYAFVPAGII